MMNMTEICSKDSRISRKGSERRR